MNTVIVVALVVVVGAAAFPGTMGLLVPARQQPPSPRGGIAGPGTPRRRLPAGRARSRRSQRALDRGFPDALEVFAVALQSGATPLQAMQLVAHHADDAIAAAFATAGDRIESGQLLDDALEQLVVQLGPRALVLVDTIRSSMRTGLPLAPMLERLADDARQHRRRHAEASARELPVRLSFPLVVCTLPAFVLVAIAPLVIGALSSLRSP
jgi:tight adherence protein C